MSSTINGVENDSNSTTLQPKKLRIAYFWSKLDAESVFRNYDAPMSLHSHNHKPDQYEITMFELEKHCSVKKVLQLVDSGCFDVFLCFCDGSFQDNTAGVEVVETLQKVNVPFSGCSPAFHSITKREMKSIAQSIGVETAPYFFVDYNKKFEITTNYVRKCAKNMKFPFIVKHFNGAGSEGLESNGKVHNEDELFCEVERITKTFGGALVEEFISGREFTVLVQENCDNPDQPIVFHPFECILKDADSFKHFDAKFIDYNDFKWQPVLEDDLVKKLKEITQKIFLACDGNFYARCDYRMCKKTGKIHFLEINPICGVFYASGFYGSADYILEYEGYHGQFLDNLIKIAFQNWKERKTAASLHFHSLPPETVFFKACQDFEAGSIAIDLTLISHKIVSAFQLNSFTIERQKTIEINSIKLTENLRLWICGDLQTTAFKRSKNPENVNSILDDFCRIVCTKSVKQGDCLILSSDI